MFRVIEVNVRVNAPAQAVNPVYEVIKNYDKLEMKTERRERQESRERGRRRLDGPFKSSRQIIESKGSATILRTHCPSSSLVSSNNVRFAEASLAKQPFVCK